MAYRWGVREASQPRVTTTIREYRRASLIPRLLRADVRAHASAEVCAAPDESARSEPRTCVFRFSLVAEIDAKMGCRERPRFPHHHSAPAHGARVHPYDGSRKCESSADAYAFPRGLANARGRRCGGCARGGTGADGKVCRRRYRRRRRSICRVCRQRTDGRGVRRARGTSSRGDGITYAVTRRLGDVGLHDRGRTRGGRGPDHFARRGGEHRRRGGARRGSPGHARRGGR